MPNIDLSILNQRQTPAFYADVFANRPAAGYVGRIFVSTDTFAFYRDNGTGWDLIGGPGTGTITGSGTAGTVPLWNGASTIGNSTLLEGTTKFTTTKDIQADAFYLNGMTAGAGALYWTSDRVTLANYNPTGIVHIEVAGGAAAQIIAADLSTTFYGNIIRNGGTSSQFLKADGSLDSNTYNTGSGVAGQVTYWNGTNALTGSNDLFWDSVNGHLGVNTNVPGTALDVHHDQPTVAILNQTVATNDVRIGFQNNGVGLWRIGAFYNAGANDFGIYDAVAAIQPVTVKKTTGQVLIGTSTVGSGKLVVASATGDNGIQIVGATAPSLRIDNAESGPTKRAGLGISTATNNFIQGSADRDFCMFNGSTTASPILFGIYGTTNVQEAARISAARNFLIGTTTDNGSKLQVSGTATISSSITANARSFIKGTAGYLFDVEEQSSNKTRFQIYIDTTEVAIISGYDTTAKPISFYTSGTRKLNIETGGNIGVNTNSAADYPGYTTFQINGKSGSGSGVLRLTSFDGTAGLNIYADNAAKINATTAIPIDFQLQDVTYMRFSTAQNLLIGTTTDNGNKLQVNGNSTFSGTMLVSTPGTGTGVIFRHLGATNNPGLFISTVESTGRVLAVASGSTGSLDLGLGGGGGETFTLKGEGQARFVPRATNPANQQAGDVYYNSTTNKLRLYDGTNWVDLN